MNTRLALITLTAGLTWTSALYAAERGTPDEAKAMLAKAVAHYKDVGRDRALSDFSKKQAPFGDRDLYVFCIGPGDVLSANGGFPSLVGGSVDVLKDANGKPLGKSLVDAAAHGGSLEYPMMNPATRRAETKVSFVEKVGTDVCGVGAFNPK